MMLDWQGATQAVIHHPLFGIGITLGAYQMVLAAFEKKHSFVVAVTILVSAVSCYFIDLSAAIFIGISSGILAGLFKHYVLKQPDPEHAGG